MLWGGRGVRVRFLFSKYKRPKDKPKGISSLIHKSITFSSPKSVKNTQAFYLRTQSKPVHLTTKFESSKEQRLGANCLREVRRD